MEDWLVFKAISEMPNYGWLMFSGVVGAIISQSVLIWSFFKKRTQETITRLDEQHREKYVDIYRLSRELDLALESFLDVSSRNGVTHSEFSISAYEMLRFHVIQFINNLDWRRNESIFFLSRPLEKRCIQLRSKLFDALNGTVILLEPEVRRKAHGRITPLSRKDIELLTRKKEYWPNVLWFKSKHVIRASKFCDRRFVKRLRKDIRYIDRKIKLILTGITSGL